MMKTYSVCLPLIGVILLQGCGVVIPFQRNMGKLSNVTIGQDRDTVRKNLGDPDSVRGSGRLPDGSVLQVDEYVLYSKRAWWVNLIDAPIFLTYPWWWPPGMNRIETFWLQYVNGKLDKWGQAGDWQPQITGDFTIRQR